MLMAISSSNKCSSPKVKPSNCSLQRHYDMPGSKGVSQWTSKSLTTKPAWNTRKQSPSSGTQNSNLSHRTCIAKTGLNALFARSRTTSWQFLPASTPPFHRTFGNPQSSPSGHSQSRDWCMGIFPRALQLQQDTTWYGWLLYPHPCKAGYLAIMGLPRKTRLQYWPCLQFLPLLQVSQV